jgi:hypothetical protein
MPISISTRGIRASWKLRSEQLDFAIGSATSSSVVHYPRARRIASWLYQQLNRVLFRLDVRDTQVGVKVFSRGVVEEVVPLLLVKQFAFDLELLAVATALGHGRIRELPVRLEYRFTGSALRSSTVLRALWDTAAVFYRLRILRTYQRKRGSSARRAYRLSGRLWRDRRSRLRSDSTTRGSNGRQARRAPAASYWRC